MSKLKTTAADAEDSAQLTIADLESGWLISALKKLIGLSHFYTDRLSLAKVTRKLERATEEPFLQRQDVIIAFGKEEEVFNPQTGTKQITKNANRITMTPENAKEFDKQLKSIRDIPVNLSGINLPITIKLRNPEMLELNADEVQAILGVVEIVEDKTDPEKDWKKEAERLGGELAEEKKKTAAIFEKLTEVAKTGR